MDYQGYPGILQWGHVFSLRSLNLWNTRFRVDKYCWTILTDIPPGPQTAPPPFIKDWYGLFKQRVKMDSPAHVMVVDLGSFSCKCAVVDRLQSIVKTITIESVVALVREASVWLCGCFCRYCVPCDFWHGTLIYQGIRDISWNVELHSKLHSVVKKAIMIRFIQICYVLYGKCFHPL